MNEGGKKSALSLYSSLCASCDELRGGMDTSQSMELHCDDDEIAMHFVAACAMNTGARGRYDQ